MDEDIEQKWMCRNCYKRWASDRFSCPYCNVVIYYYWDTYEPLEYLQEQSPITGL